MNTPEEIAKFLSLSKREREVIKLFSEKYSYKDIAEMLFVSEGAVSGYFSRAYIKLGVSELGKMDRLLILMETYFPMFSMDLGIEPEVSNELVVAEEVFDIPSPEEEESIRDDVNTFLMLHNASLTTIPQTNIPTVPKINDGEDNKPGCWTRIKRAIITFLVIFFLMTICAGYGFVEYQKGNLEFLNNIPFGITDWVEGQLGITDQSPTQHSQATSQPTITSVVVILPTNTPIPPQSTLAPTNTPLPTNTQLPTPTRTPKPIVTGPLYELGEWHEEGDFWIRLFDYKLKENLILIQVEVWNKGSQSILFTWGPTQNTFLTDNLGNDYEIYYNYKNNSDNEIIPANTKMFLLLDPFDYVMTSFEADNLFLPGVTDIYFTLEYVGRVDRATWHFEIGK